MSQVRGKGFNIYQALNRLKKTMKRPEMPIPVIAKVCTTWIYKKDPPMHKGDQWAWFTIAFFECSRDYFAYMEQKEAKAFKKERNPIAPSVKEIMKGMFNA